MQSIDISEEDYLDMLYSIADGSDTADAATSGTYQAFRDKYGRYCDLELPIVSKRNRKRFYDWCEEVGIQTDRDEIA